MMSDEHGTKNRSGKVKSESKGKTLPKARAGRKKRPSGLELSRPPEEIRIMLELEAERVVDRRFAASGKCGGCPSIPL
jgi:hypothetical protein